MNQVRFLGASVVDVGCQVGWNEQSSSLSVTLVEDDGDSFFPASNQLEYIGKPYYFSIGSLNYGGILTGWTRDYSTGGLLYRVTLTDPREILDGVQVVMNHFQLDGNLDQVILKSEMPNFFNVFDYWETAPYGTFGGAGVNEAGMPYYLVKLGILGIIENYGPIKFRGVDYYLDLEGLPTPPTYYRVNSEALSLLELVSTICQDSGADFFCNLENRGGYNVITFKTVYRTTQPPLNQIKVYTDSRENLPDNDKVVSSTSRGVELRNDVVSMVLLGGNREDVFMVDNFLGYIKPFWGFSVDGYAYTTNDYDDLSVVTLNCSEISALVGGATTYTTKVIELKAALYNFDTWAIALSNHNPNAAQYIGLKSFAELSENIINLLRDGGKPVHAANTKSDSMKVQSALANGNGTFSLQAVQAVYEFVKKKAEEHYGKTFLVKIDQVETKLVPESGEVVTSYEVTDSGYLPPGSELSIGLNGFNNDIFQDDLGKYIPFARFDSVSQADTSMINPLDVAYQDSGDTIFSKIEVEEGLVQSNQNDFFTTACVVRLPSPIVKTSQYTFGDPTGLMRLLKLSEDDIQNYLKVDGQNFGIRMPVAIIPVAAIPAKVAIPLRSNKHSYGPWRTRAFSMGGKVRFEKDDSLVPWNFGGYVGLNYAAEAKVLNVYTGMVAGEMGSVEEAGAPTKNLGDLIKAGGPNVTSINVAYGVDGVKTTYQMQTYTPKFGAFALQNAERLRRINLNTIKTRKKLKQSIRQQVQSRPIPSYLNNTFGGAKRFGGSPHEGLVAYVDDGKSEDKDVKFTTVSSDISQHFTAKFGGNLYKGDNESEFKKMGAIGFEGLFRPYLVDKEADDTYIPKFVDPTQSGVPNVTTLNPFQEGHDIDIVLKGDTEYEDYILKGEERGTPDHLRPIGLKSPMVLVGWGYDTNGNPVPTDPNDPKKFLENYLSKPEKWKAGPVDLRWHEARGVWVGGSTVELAELHQSLYSDNNTSTIASGVILQNVSKVNTQTLSYVNIYYNDNYIKRSTSPIRIYSPLRQVAMGSGSRCWVTPFGNGLYAVISSEI